MLYEVITVSNIFIENLNKLPLNQRPIHCTDPKRETIYIKNEQWEKDEDKLQTKEVIKKVSYLQVKNIKLYKEAHPQLMENQKEKDDYRITSYNVCYTKLLRIKSGPVTHISPSKNT